MAMHAPPAVAATALQFTPVSAAIGGMVLGVAALGKLAITGRVLGISGTLRGLVRGDWTRWRIAFLTGLMIGGMVAASITPWCFDVLPATFTYGRAALGGLLVGLGSALGNGCTSGHGICGISRLSKRSVAFILVSILAGIATATLTNAAEAIGIVAQPAQLTMPSKLVLQQGLLLLPMSLATMAFITSFAQTIAHNKEDPAPTRAITELVSGVMFAFGLVYSGGVRPTKVLGVLSLFHPARDLSLVFVMAGALAIAAPGFYSVLKGPQKLLKPLAGDRFKVASAASGPDAKLLLAALLFGAGWGLTGLCPGPAIVSLAVPNLQGIAFLSAMLAGMLLEWVAVSRPAQRTPDTQAA